MDQAGIIQDLLSWLEGHLDTPLSLDRVAERSGYSKWHLQRKFKLATGQAIGAYIRARRLSRAALVLRLTSRSVADIALQYGFDSQQTFTRAFKKQFIQTPALYRRSRKWHFSGMHPPYRFDSRPLPAAEFVTLPAMTLIGTSQSYTCTLEQLSEYRTNLRSHFWRQFLDATPAKPPVLYGLCATQAIKAREDRQEVFYTTAIEPQYLTDGMRQGQPIALEEGEYVQFTYQGPKAGLQNFTLDIYGHCLPMMKLIRREGADIERFRLAAGQSESADMFLCDYLIPILRDEQSLQQPVTLPLSLGLCPG
ncbi:MDR efflux pump AcrAB transcriptional activator RobA [Sodalis sp.]|uniref:MDR efflux pump AcrAB transcriptional activator RobA n=1 Tax=Sodalis sp. (in: enterobacteria) TaxID=1898979 RepID=UPI003872BF2D